MNSLIGVFQETDRLKDILRNSEMILVIYPYDILY